LRDFSDHRLAGARGPHHPALVLYFPFFAGWIGFLRGVCSKKRAGIDKGRVDKGGWPIYALANVVDFSFQSLSHAAISDKSPSRPLLAPASSTETAFGAPRDFLGNRFVYVVISSRARGLSVGINVNPNKYCNFQCVYCEVRRDEVASGQALDPAVLELELKHVFDFIREGRFREHPRYRGMPQELLHLRHVALSGDGEPTLAPDFARIVQAVVHVRALSGVPFTKLVLITNATGLGRAGVRAGLRAFTHSDEIWAKLDGGTQTYLSRVNGMAVSLGEIMANILTLARQRPVIIQSLFPLLNGAEPPAEEIEQYAARLRELISGGAKIPLVQIYSATRPSSNSSCSHLSLKTLSQIAQTVRRATGLRVEVF